MEHNRPRLERGLTPEEATVTAKREQRIKGALAYAWRTGNPIDDWTAKQIARMLDPGSGLLHEFVGTGAMPHGIERELTLAQEVAQDLELDGNLPRIAALDDYFSRRIIRGEMPYWNDEAME